MLFLNFLFDLFYAHSFFELLLFAYLISSPYSHHSFVFHFSSFYPRKHKHTLILVSCKHEYYNSWPVSRLYKKLGLWDIHLLLVFTFSHTQLSEEYVSFLTRQQDYYSQKVPSSSLQQPPQMACSHPMISRLLEPLDQGVVPGKIPYCQWAHPLQTHCWTCNLQVLTLIFDGPCQA